MILDYTLMNDDYAPLVLTNSLRTVTPETPM